MTTIMDEDGEIHYGREISSQKLHKMKVVLLHRKWKGEGVGRERRTDGYDTVVPCSFCMKNAVGRGYIDHYWNAQCHELKDAFYPPETAYEDEPIPTCLPFCDPCYNEHLDKHIEKNQSETFPDNYFLFIDASRKVFVTTGTIWRGNK